MTTATLIAPAAADVAAAEVIPSPEVLAAAVAAVSVATDADDTARATLAAVVLARYTFRAAKHLRTVDGVTVLPESKRKEVSHLLWLDATGDVTPVAAKDRTPGEASLGQYLSRYGTVAANLDYGVEGLADVDTANGCYKAISAAKAEAKANEEAAQAALDALAGREAFHAWLADQPQATRTAFKTVRHALRGDAAPHVAAFADSLIVVSA